MQGDLFILPCRAKLSDIERGGGMVILLTSLNSLLGGRLSYKFSKLDALNLSSPQHTTNFFFSLHVDHSTFFSVALHFTSIFTQHELRLPTFKHSNIQVFRMSCSAIFKMVLIIFAVAIGGGTMASAAPVEVSFSFTSYLTPHLTISCTSLHLWLHMRLHLLPPTTHFTSPHISCPPTFHSLSC